MGRIEKFLIYTREGRDYPLSSFFISGVFMKVIVETLQGQQGGWQKLFEVEAPLITEFNGILHISHKAGSRVSGDWSYVLNGRDRIRWINV